MTTIIVPVFNAAPYLDETVRSVLAQENADWELLLTDDGSTDGSGEICERWAREDARIRVLRQKNAGVSAARNAGLRLAAGEYLAFLDADDTLAPQFLSTLTALMQARGADLCLCDFAGTQRALPPYSSPRALATLMLREGGYNSVCNKLFRTALVRGQGLCFTPGVAYAEDRAFVLRYLKHCGAVAFAARPLYHYRPTANSATRALRAAPGPRILAQYAADLPLFEALGFAREEAEQGLREGAAREVYHEIWRLCEARDRPLARRWLRELLRGPAADFLRGLPRCRVREMFPGRAAAVLLPLAKLRCARLIELIVRLPRRRPM